MAHQPKPFYRTSRVSFYVQLGKQQIKLVSGPNDPATEKLAWDAFHKLMAARAGAADIHVGLKPESAVDAQLSVAGVMDKYLGWCQIHRSPRTYEWTQNHLQSFCDRIKSLARADALALKPFHVVEWVDSKSTWGANQKRGAIVAVQRPFSWAAKLGYIERNPVAGIEKPRAVRRERYVTPEEFRQLVSHYPKGDPFHDYLTFLWETGCRPQEARHIEPRHFNPEFARFDIPPAEAKGKKRWRVIRTTPLALEIATRRMGLCVLKVFENEDGKPWTADAINCRFQRLKKSKGLACFSYALRHGFCQKKLEEGHDHLTVAELMGHANGQMVASVYSHMSKAEEHLKKAIS